MNDLILFIEKVLYFLPENPTDQEINIAYKKLSTILHPDKHPENKQWADERMKLLNQAKEILLDPVKLADYKSRITQINKGNIEKEQITRQRDEFAIKLLKEQEKNTRINRKVNLGIGITALGLFLFSRKKSKNESPRRKRIRYRPHNTLPKN